MSRRARLEVGEVMRAAMIATGAGFAVWIGLATLATPPDLAQRLAHVRKQIEAAADIGARAGHASTYPENALCAKAPSAASATIKQDIQTAVAGAGVSLARLDVVAGVGDEALAGLTPIHIDLETSGGYDQTLLLLKALARLRPQIFLSRTDLQSKITAVSLKVSGQAYCSAYARL